MDDIAINKKKEYSLNEKKEKIKEIAAKTLIVKIGLELIEDLLKDKFNKYKDIEENEEKNKVIFLVKKISELINVVKKCYTIIEESLNCEEKIDGNVAILFIHFFGVMTMYNELETLNPT